MKSRDQLPTLVKYFPIPAAVVGGAVGGALKIISNESRPSVLAGAAIMGAFTTAVAYFVPMLEDGPGDPTSPNL